ncbi:MAG TPA: hypothetical protein VFV65_03225 [Gemmatimonadales bacterium]|nr:hypothetical protein [Gemmatimonadales bacterium]
MSPASLALPRPLVVLLAAPIFLGCDNSTAPQYDPVIPTQWAAAVTNDFLPWAPGTVYTYGGAEDITVEVLVSTRTIMGVTATEVRDQVFEGGVLVEDTYDWYAQDIDGNVWYLGEDTKEYENGQVTSTEGSWEWGNQGALPGIVMWADPSAHLNERYRQEYLRGVAEDVGKVIATGVSVTVPFGTYTGCIRTLDTSALELTLREHKTYCPGVGLVLETEEDGSAPVELTNLDGP